MTDKYPENFEIEIDRDALYKYLCVKWLGLWVLGPVAFITFLTVLTAAIFFGSTYDNDYDPVYTQNILPETFKALGKSLIVAEIILVPASLLFIYFVVRNMARSLTVSVEGAFLHIVQGILIRVDRKLHFRSIVDYAVVDDILMRCFGVIALRMTTTGVGLESTITLVGIKDCLKVRDMLAEIDSIREIG